MKYSSRDLASKGPRLDEVGVMERSKRRRLLLVRAALYAASLSMEVSPAVLAQTPPLRVTDTSDSQSSNAEHAQPQQSVESFLETLDEASRKEEWERYVAMVDPERRAQMRELILEAVKTITADKEGLPILDVFNIRDRSELEKLPPERVLIQTYAWSSRLMRSPDQGPDSEKTTLLGEVTEGDLHHVLYRRHDESGKSDVIVKTAKKIPAGWLFEPDVNLDMGAANFLVAMAEELAAHAGTSDFSSTSSTSPAGPVVAPKAENGNQDEPVLVVGDVKPPALTRRVSPRYPEAARLARLEGKVILEAIIEINGRVSALRALKRPEVDFGLVLAAEDAVRQWQYDPAMQQGKPVKVFFTVIVDFTLR